jgi:hypothetical protein
VAVFSVGMWIVLQMPVSPPIVASIVPISCMAHAGETDANNRAAMPQAASGIRFVAKLCPVNVTIFSSSMRVLFVVSNRGASINRGKGPRPKNREFRYLLDFPSHNPDIRPVVAWLPREQPAPMFPGNSAWP